MPIFTSNAVRLSLFVRSSGIFRTVFVIEPGRPRFRARRGPTPSSAGDRR